MKKSIIILILFLSNYCFSQLATTAYKVVPILATQNFYLNSFTRIGGITKTTLKIDLPQNTVEWYYIFSTSPNKNANNNLELVENLTNLVLSDPTGFSGKVVTSLVAPTGVGVCNIYLMDGQNSLAFENAFADFNYKTTGSRENFTSGIIQIRNITSGSWYLGFQNPSSTTGMNVSVEVAAVVLEQNVDYNVWTNETKNSFYSTFYDSFIQENVEQDLSKYLANCLSDQIIAQTTPNDFNNLADNERETFITTIYEKCVAELDGPISPNYEKAVMYGNLGWKAFENGNIDKCIEYSQKALNLDNNLGYVKANLGLCYMINGDETKATYYYIEAISVYKKSKFASIIKQNLQATITDIDNSASKYPAMKGANDIKSLLESELNNY